LLGESQITEARTKWWGPDRHIVTWSRGSADIAPFTILLTVPFDFSKTKKSSCPSNAILVGNSNPLNTRSALRLGLVTLGVPDPSEKFEPGISGSPAVAI
jgi:hypothetical protein